MKYTSKKLPESVIELDVVLTHQEFLEYYQPIYDRALSSVNLKGFRPGTAPKEMADKAVDKEKVFNEAVNKAVRDALQEITEENDWQVIDQPKVEVLETNPQANLGLKFKVTLTIFPKVELGNYQKIAKGVLAEATPVSIDEKEIEKSVNWILNSRAKVTRVNREAKNGDVVEIEYNIRTPDIQDIESNAGISGVQKLEKDSFVLGEGKFVFGFEENIMGHKEGENLEFSVTFPADYWNKELQNKKVDFKVKLNGVFEREVPALTDEFVKGLGKFQTVEEFTNNIKDGLTKEAEEKENERLKLKIIEEIIKNSKIELPAIMVNRTLENLVAEYKTFVKNAKSDEEIRKNLEEKAKNSVVTNLVLYQIAKNEHLEPDSKEVEAEANHYLSESGFSKNKANLDQQRIYDYSYGIVQNRKVFEYLESLK